MNCETTQERLGTYLDGECSAEEARAIAEHLARCNGCAHELALLQRLESTVRAQKLVGPNAEYWNDVSAAVLARLGLNRAGARTRWGLGRLGAALADALLPPTRLAWAGLAVAAVVLVVVWFQGRERGPVRPPEMAHEQPKALTPSSGPREEAALPSVRVESDEVEAPPASLTQNVPAVKPTSPQGTGDMPVAQDAKTEPERVAVLEPQEWRDGAVRPLPPRAAQVVEIEKPRFDDLIYPVLNARFLVDNLETGDEVDQDRLPVRTLSLGTTPAKGFSGPPTQIEQLRELGNDFYETFWIVEQSVTLEEKRNIWLSYLKRETNPTYRALGVFNLAIVLSQLVEQTRDPELAQEALEFFQENARALNFQMGEKRYQQKVQEFRKLVNH